MPLTFQSCVLPAGYSAVSFTGDAIDDSIMLEVAHNADLVSMYVSIAPRVTDIGLGGAVAISPNLQTLSLQGTSLRATFGHFLPKVLELRHLQHLELKSTMLALQDMDPARVPHRCALMNLTHTKGMHDLQVLSLQTSFNCEVCKGPGRPVCQHAGM